MNNSRRNTVLTLAALPWRVAAQVNEIEAPNPVRISPRLLTSGQPTPQALASLGMKGIEVVIYLAPGSVPDAVQDESAILAGQGIEFIHIPIPFAAPQEEHITAVSQALSRRKERSVLVHCQVNMRASTAVFLHRAIALREPPVDAYQAVTRVWSPEGAWRKLMLDLLRKSGIDFQPL